MLRLITILTFVSVLAGCSLFWNNDNRWAYQCPDGYEFQATFAHDGESMLIEHEGSEIKLNRVETASGGKYSDGFTTVWAKGAGAQMLYQGELIHGNCSGDRLQP
jgi:membrane-bound inhibitor of C-type lysozyme